MIKEENKEAIMISSQRVITVQDNISDEHPKIEYLYRDVANSYEPFQKCP
jgi:hypothetical protein